MPYLLMLLFLLPLPALAFDYPPVLPDHPLQFPRDLGSHPAFRTEWWYVTGQVQTPQGKPLGFQITFFRTSPPLDTRNPSRFTPRQILFAHAALADPQLGKLLVDEKAARAGFGLAGAAIGHTQAWIDDWRLEQTATGYRARIPAKGFTLDLQFAPTQPRLLQGAQGYSRKSPTPGDASYYYSEPQLRVTGAITRQGRTTPVQGRAWLDHEWSSNYLNKAASGWDWLGLNLDDGGALMLFRMRRPDGSALWASGTFRDKQGRVRVFAPGEVRFKPLAYWTSPRSGIRYPVRWQVAAPGVNLELRPLMPDQELDTRASTGTRYWEGAVEAWRDGQRVGRGYLELTGYGRRLRM